MTGMARLAWSNKAESPFTAMLIFFNLPFVHRSRPSKTLSCPTDEHDYTRHGVWVRASIMEFIHAMDDTFYPIWLDD